MTATIQTQTPRLDRARRAFTLLELLALMALLSLGFMLLVPALARTGPDTRAARCQNNLKQLTVAWTLYAADHTDALAINNFGNTVPDSTGWITGWLDWTTSTQNTNTLLVADERYAKMAPYFRRDARLFKCPAENYTIFGRARVRSISMDASVGPGSTTSKEEHFPGFFVTVKMTDFITPSPARVWVLADEQADSINDGCLLNDPMLSPAQYRWVDLPASYHSGGCMFSFADAHVELKRWTDPRTLVPVRMGGFSMPSCPNSPDYAWLKDRTPVRP